MKNVSVKVDGLMLLTVLSVGAVSYLYFKKSAIAEAAGKVVDAVNPASKENLVNKGVTAVVGEENIATAADYIFGGIDLLNPWNESDTYARQVYGLGGGEK